MMLLGRLWLALTPTVYEAFLVAICLGLAGCVTARAPTTPMPVAVSCVPDDFPIASPRPATRDSLRSAPDMAARFQQLAEFFTVEDPRLDLDESVIAACRKVSGAKP